jgi:catalase
MWSLLYAPLVLGTAMAASCPYMSNQMLAKRQVSDSSSIDSTSMADAAYFAQFETNDTNSYMTTDWGTRIDDSVSLKAGQRGPTLLEDFIFRQKLQHFDHERVSQVLPFYAMLTCYRLQNV